MNKDRIRLAKAMKIKPKRQYMDIRHLQRVSCGEEAIPEPIYPDPFTDANDDYACLQYAREQHWIAYMEYYLCMIGESRTDYKVGDYARALLGVIDHEDD